MAASWYAPDRIWTLKLTTSVVYLPPPARIEARALPRGQAERLSPIGNRAHLDAASLDRHRRGGIQNDPDLEYRSSIPDSPEQGGLDRKTRFDDTPPQAPEAQVQGAASARVLSSAVHRLGGPSPLPPYPDAGGGPLDVTARTSQHRGR